MPTPSLPVERGSACAAAALPRAVPQLPGVWRGDGWQQAQQQRVQPSGHGLLDAQLPGGGWPLGGMVELLQPAHAHAEWPLLLPGLAGLMQRSAGQVVLVAPPCQPFVPGLQAAGVAARRLCCVQADAARPGGDGMGLAWVCEQALRCRDVLAVIAWLPAGLPAATLRRLQWAAATQGRVLWLWREDSAALQATATPALLRLRVDMEPGEAGAPACLRVHLLKRRGPALEQALRLPLAHWSWQGVLQAQARRRDRQAGEARHQLHGHGLPGPQQATAWQAHAAQALE
jgi:protein ImuA